MYFLLLLFLPLACCTESPSAGTPEAALRDSLPAVNAYGQRLAAAALRLTEQAVVYDPAYVVIPYPNGDVPANRGVCSDVVIRAYRQLGVDLQRLVHEDMRAHFSAYPKRWGLSRPDPNIDHRRVPNLQVFFQRKKAALPVTQRGADYLPGDVVSWLLPGGLPHIGVVSAQPSTDGQRYCMVHNIGSGQVLADCLFAYPITGHFRFQH